MTSSFQDVSYKKNQRNKTKQNHKMLVCWLISWRKWYFFLCFRRSCSLLQLFLFWKLDVYAMTFSPEIVIHSLDLRWNLILTLLISVWGGRGVFLLMPSWCRGWAVGSLKWSLKSFARKDFTASLENVILQKVCWQGSLYYLLNEWNTGSKGGVE